MSCELCERLKEKDGMVYEDDKVACFMAGHPAVAGHIIVVPKKHAPIFEMFPDDDAAHMFKIANKMSIALFETIKAEGTNILTHNGTAAGQDVPHFCINVIARRDGDGLMFEWSPKRLSEDEMAQVELGLKKEMEGELEAEEKIEKDMKAAKLVEEKPVEEKPDGEKPEEEKTKEEKPAPENYLVKQLRRMP
ncbi:HIT family protein [Nanoarchaeota archaeon]